MPADSAADPIQSLQLQQVQRQGLRIALAASVGLAGAAVAGSPVPFLLPLFAAQFLVTDQRPLRLGQGIGMFVLIVVMGQVMTFLTTLLGDRPIALLPVLWLV